MPEPKPRTRRRKEAGYTLLMAAFLVATMLIVASAATQDLLTQGRREKEEDMIWRGEQYKRAIGLYYKKIGKYPTKIEDLTRQTNGVRFLRQAYKDPMNTDDGSWRFIYVGPNGQLIGSLRQTSLLQNALMPQGLGASPFGAASPLGGPGGANSQPFQLPGMNGGQQQGIGAQGQNTNPALAPNPLAAQPQALDGNLIGGNIIGVGSKMKKPSLKVYLGANTYQQWEFIWNPAGQVGGAGQAGVNPNLNPTGAPNGAAPGAAPPAGTAPGTPDNQQQQNPQTPSVNVPGFPNQ